MGDLTPHSTHLRGQNRCHYFREVVRWRQRVLCGERWKLVEQNLLSSWNASGFPDLCPPSNGRVLFTWVSFEGNKRDLRPYPSPISSLQDHSLCLLLPLSTYAIRFMVTPSPPSSARPTFLLVCFVLALSLPPSLCYTHSHSLPAAALFAVALSDGVARTPLPERPCPQDLHPRERPNERQSHPSGSRLPRLLPSRHPGHRRRRG